MYADRTASVLPHIVLERLGDSLDTVVGENGESPLDLRDSVDLLRQLVDTVTEIHKRNIMHGDIQPRNVLKGRDGRWKLIDPARPGLTTWKTSMRGEPLDFLGVGRTFLVAYYGVESYEDIPDDEAAELEEIPDLVNLLRRMLGRRGLRSPSGASASRATHRIWKQWLE
jgi:serine/threonine protein kinase